MRVSGIKGGAPRASPLPQDMLYTLPGRCIISGGKGGQRLHAFCKHGLREYFVLRVIVYLFSLPDQVSGTAGCATAVYMSRVVIATVWDGVQSRTQPMNTFQCALLGWCQSSAQLASILVASTPATSADVRIILTAERSRRRRALTTINTDCPDASVMEIDLALRRAVEAYRTRTRSHECPHVCTLSAKYGPCLYKLQLLSLEKRFDLIIYADLDVTLLRPEQPPEHVAARWRRTWEEVLPPDGSTRALFSNDAVSATGSNIAPLPLMFTLS